MNIAAATLFDDISSLSRVGDFQDALSKLESDRPLLRGHNEELFLTLLAELAFETGIEETAAASAREALRLRPSAEYTARIERVLAMHAFNAGELAASIEHLESARAHAGQGRYLVLRASIELTYMWLALTFRSLETPLAALPHVRLAVARAGDSTLLAQLRIYVGRTEARRGSLVEAQRHYSLADRLLVNNPNVWLQGILEIDRSVVHMLLGDNEAAIAAADSAASLSLQSGHHHTKLAAAINKSHVLERMGHLEPARKCVEYALGASGSNKHLIRAALDSLANLEITAGRYSECRILFEETARRARADAGARPHWDAISELASRSRLAIAERNLKGAIDDLSDAIKLANDFGDNLSEIRLRIRRARALGLDAPV